MGTKRQAEDLAAAAAVIGRKGGCMSRKYMTPEEASELGRRAAQARWAKAKQKAAKKRKGG